MWVVDTCIVIDVAEGDPEFGKAWAKCLASHLPQGLCISPVTYVELAPVFMGMRGELDRFLALAGLSVADFSDEGLNSAFSAWNTHISRRRTDGTAKRPIADIFIGSLAARHEGLITRSSQGFKALFPGVRIVDPSSKRRR